MRTAGDVAKALDFERTVTGTRLVHHRGLGPHWPRSLVGYSTSGVLN